MPHIGLSEKQKENKFDGYFSHFFSPLQKKNENHNLW
jgi:hypothetical protein